VFIHSKGQKKQQIIPDIPKWELESGFDPLFIQRRLRENHVDYRGVISTHYKVNTYNNKNKTVMIVYPTY
jgi:hypothetical protein